MTTSPTDRRWLGRIPEPGRLNVICLPQAGGDTSLYNRWRPHLTGGAEIIPVHLPGRGMRFAETPLTRMEAVVEALTDVLRPYLGMPYVLLGSSMGGWIAHALTQHFLDMALPLPRGLILCSSSAPFEARVYPDVETEDRDELIRNIIDFNPDFVTIAEHDELVDLLLPCIRADFRLCIAHRARAVPLIPVPVLAFSGREDRIVTTAQMTGWRQMVAGPFDLREISGNHFLIETTPPDIIAALNRLAAEVPAPAVG